MTYGIYPRVTVSRIRRLKIFLKLEDIAGYSIIMEDQSGMGVAHQTADVLRIRITVGGTEKIMFTEQITKSDRKVRTASDINMTQREQDVIIQVIRRYFE